MIGPITIKRAIKRTTGWAAVLTDMLTRNGNQPKGCIFYYHRVADLGFIDTKADDWNVQPKLFEEQMAALAEFAEVVPLHEMASRLASHTSKKPLVSLTFDDGYANFFARALPVLERYNLPATVFVVTGLIGQSEPMSFDGWSRRNISRAHSDVWRAMSWQEIESCAASSLITIGAHSHRHLKGRESSEAQLVEEASLSREILSARLGERHALAYAYPYGSTRLGYVPQSYVEAVRAAGFKLAVTTDLGLVEKDNDLFLLPRLEASGVDSPSVIRAKAAGALAPYYLTDRLRMARRAV